MNGQELQIEQNAAYQDMETSNKKAFDIGNAGSSYTRTFNGQYNNTFTSGDRYYVYGSWTY